MNMGNIFAVAMGAIFGALLRWKIGDWLNGTGEIAWGVLLVNVVGCFLMGFLLSLRLPEFWQLLLATGFLGSLTTFSTFAAEVFNNQNERSGVVVFMLHIIGGGMGFLLGRWCGRI